MSTKSPAGPVRWLDPDEERAWRAFLRVVVAVRAGTARDLAAAGLSEADYEVLSTLSERPDRASTLGEQADKMGWSRSRLSRHATRMQARGLLRRAPDPSDGRGCFLVLTAQGLHALEGAAPAHVESVRRHFIDRLAPDDLTAIERIARKLEEPRTGPDRPSAGPDRRSAGPDRPSAGRDHPAAGPDRPAAGPDRPAGGREHRASAPAGSTRPRPGNG